MVGLVAGAFAAAVFIWLTVRVCNRRDRRAIMFAEGLGSVFVVGFLASQAAPEVNGSWWTAICALEFSPDGNSLAAGLFDGKGYNEDFHWRNRDFSQSVSLFDAKTGTHRTELNQTRAPGPFGGSSPLGTFIAFSPDGNTLAIGSYDGLVRLWDLRTNALRHTLTSQTSPLKVVAFTGDGKRLIAAGHINLTVWETDKYGPGQRIDTVGSRHSSIACSPDSTRMAVGSEAFGGVEIVDLRSGKVSRLDPNRTDRVLAVAFSPDGGYVAAGEDASVVVWNLEENRKEFEVAVPWPRAIAFSPDGQILATAGQNGSEFWDAKTGAVMKGFPASGRIVSLTYSPDGQLLALGDWSGGVSVWDLKSRSRLWTAHMSGPTRPPGPWTVATSVVAAILLVLMVRLHRDQPRAGASPLERPT